MPKYFSLSIGTASPSRGSAVSRLALAALAASVLLLACGSDCPHATTRVGEICRRNDGIEGQMTDANTGADANADSPTSSSAGGSNTGKAGGNSGPSSAGGGRGGVGASGRRADSAASGSGGNSPTPQGDDSGAAAGTGGMNKPVEGTAGTSGSAGNANASPRCGDGVKGAGETCDGADCPDSCPEATGCMVMKLTGSAATCDAECVPSQIKVTEAGDGCCPAGADASKDSDCPAKCGDGIIDSNEKCEPSSTEKPCPSSCDDNDPCTKDTLTGSAAQCTAVCVNTRITKAVAGDMCCPSGANAETDGDCPTKCGDGVVTGNETCDSKSTTQRCPSSCDDGDPCTADKLNGNAAQCTAECTTTPVTAAKSGDGCCPKGATANTDNDCPSMCGDGTVTGNEECDPKAKGWSAWTCSAECTRASLYMPCGSDSDCFGDYFGKRPTCNLTYAVCTIPCVGSNTCPAAPGGLTAECTSLGASNSGCVATGCKSYTDCGLGSSCVPLPLTGSQALVCLGCDTHAECPTGTMCRFMGSFGICK